MSYPNQTKAQPVVRTCWHCRRTSYNLPYQGANRFWAFCSRECRDCHESGAVTPCHHHRSTVLQAQKTPSNIRTFPAVRYPKAG